MAPDLTRFARRLAAATFIWVLVYAPIETYYTLAVAGPRGLIFGSYVMNVLGMALMTWGAVALHRARPHAPGLATAGWSWTAATFWRATADRYSWAAIGGRLLAGPSELWLAPLLTFLACLGLVAALVLVFRTSRF